MIYVNVDGLEYLSDMLSALASKSDNEFFRIKDTAGELQNNTQFQTYPQFMPACDAMFRASDEMNRLNEKISALSILMKELPAEYIEREKEKIALIEKAIGTMELIGAGLASAIQTTDGVTVRVSDEALSTDEVQKMVANDYLRVMMTDITSVSKKVQEEYEVKNVVPVSSDLAAEVSAASEKK